jgi:Na+/H+ antiporter NhaC
MTNALINIHSNSPYISIIFIILLLILLWYMYYRQLNMRYINERSQLISNLYSIKEGFNLIGFTIILLIMIVFGTYSIVYKENMTNSTISSTDPMVISQTTAGAIKMIHDQLTPIQITQDLIDQLRDAVNDQSDQISTLQTNSVS